MKSSTVYYDNICVLCSRSVRFIRKNDPRGKFVFAPLQSADFDTAAHALRIHEDSIPDSIVLLQNSKMYTRSGAVLRIAARLRFPWPLFALFFLIPRFLRNPLYDLIAKNRYKWFGKKDQCAVS